MRTPPTQFLELLNSIQKDFIWNNSRAKTKHCSIIADYKEGGYKDVDISSKLLPMKISWIKRFLDDSFHPCKILPTRLPPHLGGSSIFHYNLQSGDRCSTIVKTFPTFNQELIELWCKISYQKPSDITQIYNKSLWNNSFIVTQGRPIFNLSFINKGILEVSDILKGELQRENKLISYEGAFKMLENDMYIAGIGQVVLEVLSVKVGPGNHQKGISLLQKFLDIFGNMRLVSPKMTSHLTSHNFQILKIDIFSKLCKICTCKLTEKPSDSHVLKII